METVTVELSLEYYDFCTALCTVPGICLDKIEFYRCRFAVIQSGVAVLSYRVAW